MAISSEVSWRSWLLRKGASTNDHAGSVDRSSHELDRHPVLPFVRHVAAVNPSSHWIDMFVTQEPRLTGTEEAADAVVVHMLNLVARSVRRVNRTKAQSSVWLGLGVTR
jgi:hypothetical protein